MLRASFLVFVCGWVLWFMLDKPAAVQFSFPERSDDLLGNFQYAFDMLKAGYPRLGFIFIWQQHYIVLSLLGGAILALVTGSLSDLLRRRRMRRLVLPGTRHERRSNTETQPGPQAPPADNGDLVRDKRIE
jgi:hypothetical protein